MRASGVSRAPVVHTIVIARATERVHTGTPIVHGHVAGQGFKVARVDGFVRRMRTRRAGHEAGQCLAWCESRAKSGERNGRRSLRIWDSWLWHSCAPRLRGMPLPATEQRASRATGTQQERLYFKRKQSEIEDLLSSLVAGCVDSLADDPLQCMHEQLQRARVHFTRGVVVGEEIRVDRAQQRPREGAERR